MGSTSHLRQPFGIFVIFCCVASAATQSFESQFTSSVYYALAIAGISLGSAIAVAALGLLIFCLVRRRKRLNRKPKRLDTEASNSSSSQQQQRQWQQGQGASHPAGKKQLAPAVDGAPKLGGGGGGMALPLPALPKPSAASGGGSHGSSGIAAAAMAKYENPAFDSREAGAVTGSGSRGSGGAVGLYRQSSALRPVSYASLESSSKSHGSGSHDRPVITHAVARTSPAATLALDPRQFLSQGVINHLPGSAQLKRMSYAEQSSLQQQPERSQQAGLEKRLSYAEKRSQVGSNIELSSGQVFLASNSSLQRQQYPLQQQPSTVSLPRYVIQAPTLATQPEEATVGNGVAGFEEGPSFPITKPISQAIKPPQPQPQPQHPKLLQSQPQPKPPTQPPTQSSSQPQPKPLTQPSAQSLTQPSTQPLPKPPTQPPTQPSTQSQPKPPMQPMKTAGQSPPLPAGEQPRNPRNLRRFQLGGGVGGGGDDGENKSVTSTVLKQEAIQAFEFLDNYDDDN